MVTAVRQSVVALGVWCVGCAVIMQFSVFERGYLQWAAGTVKRSTYLFCVVLGSVVFLELVLQLSLCSDRLDLFVRNGNGFFCMANEAEMRVGVLKIGVAAGAIGTICYVLMLLEAPSLAWIQYNFAAQALTGIVLTNLALVISRNRLQGFIALLPLLMIIVLLINAIAVLSILAIHHFSVVDGQSAVVFSNDFAFILYFSLHLVIAAILAVHIFRKIKLEYPVLMILLTISASLPLWSTFAYIS